MDLLEAGESVLFASAGVVDLLLPFLDVCTVESLVAEDSVLLVSFGVGEILLPFVDI